MIKSKIRYGVLLLDDLETVIAAYQAHNWLEFTFSLEGTKKLGQLQG